nr:hypothetical protein BaRGS_023380 [Batillaria attramentaria]KAG5709643.1 hypothetical protein BaRGS_001693 [Batillaria attramentaria]
MAIPSSVLAAGWIPFVVVLVLTLLFSAIYIRYYMSKYDTLYGIICFCFFILLPFMYFFYEEKDENSTCKSRCCSGLKYLIVFIIIAVALLLIGAFVPTKSAPNSNSTDWQKVEALFEGLGSNGGQDAISFVISVFSLLGMLGLVTYTAYGMSALPMELMTGKGSAKRERMTVQHRREANRSRREAIHDKREAGLEEEDRLMARQERHLQEQERSWCQKCLMLLRPFEIVLGVVCFLLGLLIFISLLLTK